MCTHTFLSLEATSSMTFCTPSSDSCLEAAAVLEDRDTPRERKRKGRKEKERKRKGGRGKEREREREREVERERERERKGGREGEFNHSSLDLVVDTLIHTNLEQLDKHVLQSLLDLTLQVYKHAMYYRSVPSKRPLSGTCKCPPIPCLAEASGRCLAAILATVSLGGGRSFTNECSSRILHAIFLFNLHKKN